MLQTLLSSSSLIFPVLGGFQAPWSIIRIVLVCKSGTGKICQRMNKYNFLNTYHGSGFGVFKLSKTKFLSSRNLPSSGII